MSNKTECPSCKSYGSGVYDAWMGDREACPVCGLPASVIREVMETRKSLADEVMKSEHEALLIQVGQLTARARKAERTIEAIRSALREEQYE